MNEQQPFEAIRKSDEAGREYWSARNLGPLLDYKSGGIFIRSLQKR
jgi:DNA-damage-inducible protein D